MMGLRINCNNKCGSSIVNSIIFLLTIVVALLFAITIFDILKKTADGICDKSCLRTLNLATQIYLSDPNSNWYLFTEYCTDEERISALVKCKLIDKKVSAKKKNTSFVWDERNQIWKISYKGS